MQIARRRRRRRTRAAALWTLQALSEENAEYIRNLPKGPLMLDGFQVVHGSPFDEDEYVIAAKTNRTIHREMFIFTYPGSRGRR